MAAAAWRVTATLDGVAVTDSLVTWSTESGRASPIERFQPATATVVLDNALGRFDPTLGRVSIGDTLKLEVARVSPPSTPDLAFNGIVLAVSMSVAAGASVVTIEAAERPAGEVMIDDGTYTFATVGELLEGLALAVVGVDPITVLYATVASAYEVAPDPVIVSGGLPFWETVNEIVEAAGGALGKLTAVDAYYYVPRAYRISTAWGYHVAAPVVIGDGAVASEPHDLPIGFEVVIDDADLVNDATFERAFAATASTVQVTDDVSITSYGRRSVTRQGPFSDAALARLAGAMVARFAAPQAAIREVQLEHAEMLPYDALLPVLWGVFFYTGMVKVVYRPAYAAASPRSAFYLVDGRRISGEADGSIALDLTLSPTTRDGAAIYDQAAFGGYGVGRYA